MRSASSYNLQFSVSFPAKVSSNDSSEQMSLQDGVGSLACGDDVITHTTTPRLRVGIQYSLNVLRRLRQYPHVSTLCRRDRRALFALRIWQPPAVIIAPILLTQLCSNCACALCSSSLQQRGVCTLARSTILPARLPSNHLQMSMHMHAVPTFCISAVCLCALVLVGSLRLFLSAINLLQSSFSALRACLLAVRLYDWRTSHPPTNADNSSTTADVVGVPRRSAAARQAQRAPNSVEGVTSTFSLLRCMLANARSMCNKSDLISDCISQHQIDFLCLTESWLTGDDTFDEAVLTTSCPSSHSFISSPRCNKRGGGLAVLYRSTIKVAKCNIHFSPTSFELLTVMIASLSRSVVCAVIYRPPKFSVATFLSELADLCSHLSSYSDFIIVGDMNVRDLSGEFASTLSAFGLTQHVTEPTHDSGHTLDLVLSRSSSSIVSCTHTLAGLSDHLSVKFDLSLSTARQIRSSTATRSFRHIDSEALQNDFSQFVTTPLVHAAVHPPSTPIPSLSHGESLVHLFQTNVTAVLDLHAPVSIRRASIKVPLPWFTTAVRLERRELRRAERRWRCSRLEVHRQIYTAQRLRLHAVITQEKKYYLQTELSEHSTDSKRIWRTLNGCLGRVKPLTLPKRDSLQHVVDSFAEFFRQKVINLRSSISQDHSIRQANESISSSPLPEEKLEFFRCADPAEVRRTILDSPNKSCPLDCLPTWLLRSTLPSLLPAISLVVNHLLVDGLPSSLKRALVYPLLKKRNADPDLLENYRPVSNLPFLSKLVERIVATRLTEYLEGNSLLDANQSAYRRFYSCESVLIHVFDTALRGMDLGKVTALLLLDLSSAFDTVEHSILLRNLESLGVRGSALRWFGTYLSDRSQSVCINSTSSCPTILSTGVPQGSVLGPLLFTVYLHGIGEIIKAHHLQYKLYADDIQVYATFDTADSATVSERFNLCVKELATWLAQRFLILNWSKTELIVLGTEARLRHFDGFSVEYNGISVPCKSVVRDLGVWIDQSLKADHHITTVCKSAFTYLRLLHRVRHLLPENQRVLLAHSLILSRLDYCSAFFAGISAKQESRLQRIIHAAFRVACGIRRHQSISTTLELHGCLPIRSRVQLKIATQVYKALNGLAPSYITGLLIHQRSTRELRSNAMDLLEIPRCSTATGRRAFSIFAPLVWNSFPLDIRRSSSLSIFCTRAHAHLLASAFVS